MGQEDTHRDSGEKRTHGQRRGKDTHAWTAEREDMCTQRQRREATHTHRAKSGKTQNHRGGQWTATETEENEGVRVGQIDKDTENQRLREQTTIL